MWRGVSLRKLGVLLFAPMLSETLATMFQSWMVLQATKAMDLPPKVHMWVPIMGSIGYAVSAFIAGRWVTPRAAPWLMVTAILMVTGFGVTAMAANHYWAFLACSFVMGCAFGHYYTPFQINMTHVQPFRTLAWSVAFYNIAWGMGAAVGPFLGGWLREQPLLTLAGIAVVIAFVHTVLNALAWAAPMPKHEVTMTTAFSSTPRQRWTGLAAFLVMNVAIRGLYITLWPNLGKENNWTDVQIGTGQFFMFLPVAVAALLWARLRFRLNKPWIMLGSMVVGMVGLALLPLMKSWAGAVACASCVGLMESCVVFHAIYYMNADPDPKRRGRNVGLFEMTAGLAAISGPLLMGLLAWESATNLRPYLFGAATLAMAITAMAWMELRNRKDQPAHNPAP